MTPFGVSKFRGLLLAGSFTVLAGYVVRLSDTVIAGNLLGADALAGVGLAGPILSAVSFLGGLVATGMGTVYSLALGRCDLKRAREYATQAIWTVLALGGLLSLACLFGRDAYLSFFGASPAATEFARGYLSWLWPVAVIEGLEALLVSLCYADGDARLCVVANVAVFLSNIVFSVIGIRFGMGTAGCAMGTVVADVIGCLVLAAHFLRSGNSFRIARHFAPRDSWHIVSASFGDAAAFLCDSLLFLFLNKFAILKFGPEVLPVVGVAVSLWGFLELFNGVGVAIQPIVTVYYGEGNTLSARRVMNSAMKMSVIEGLLAMAIFLLFPRQVIGLLGIEDPSLMAVAVTAVRVMSCGFVALALAGLLNSYYMFVERALMAGLVTFLCYLVMPVAAVAGLSMLGVTGVWLGMGLGPVFGILFAGVLMILTGGFENFPFMLPLERDLALRVFDLRLDDREISRVSEAVGEEMRRAGQSESSAVRAALMVEEVFQVVKDRNRGRKVLAEATLDFNSGASLTLRDDGVIFDITDADAEISSLRTFLVASIMEAHKGRVNLVTTGFNRNVFKFA